MWYFEMKYRNNCSLGGHFNSRDEMYWWIISHFKHYTFYDKFISFRIWYEEEDVD